MPVPEKVIDLIERFKDNREAYRSSSYNETQARRELIDPFFKALGWDIDNEAGYAEGYKNAVHEDAIEVGGTKRTPDYVSFEWGSKQAIADCESQIVILSQGAYWPACTPDEIGVTVSSYALRTLSAIMCQRRVSHEELYKAALCMATDLAYTEGYL
jgi:hypothetical protein